MAKDFLFTFNLWCKTHSKNEINFMWVVWNKLPLVVVNIWRVNVDDSINQTCPMCGNGVQSILHRFWDCNPCTTSMRIYTQGIVYGLAYGNKPFQATTLMQSKKKSFLQPRHKGGFEVWRTSSLRSITLWMF